LAKWIALSWIVLVLSCVGPFLPWSRLLWRRLALVLVCLAALTILLTFLVGSPASPSFPSDDGATRLSEKIFVAAWWLILARSIITAGRIALRANDHLHSARLASDLAAAIVYLGSAIAILDLVFGISVTGLIATSGIIAIVLGLALQSTLGDLFSGIAIGIDRPFNVGDVVLIEGAVEGRVVETNWRSTRVATATNDIATVPNSVVAKSRITNRSVPSESHMGSAKIVIDPTVPPLEAIAMLRASVLNAALVSATPPPVVACTELSGDGATYEINFSAPLPTLSDARSDLLHQVARHARYSGMALARASGAPIVPVVVPDTQRLLDDILIFESLKGEARNALASQLVRREGEAGDALLTQGGAVTSVFVIAKGALVVTRNDGSGRQLLGALGPGDFFGELALLMGTPNAATVVGLTKFVAYELTKDAVAPFLTDHPELLHALERGAEKARSLIERRVAAQTCADAPPSVHTIDRIRAFFGGRDHLPALHESISPQTQVETG
jgi:small-conductance mechanosensitive channel/CRP-like cAMP-binding protein